MAGEAFDLLKKRRSHEAEAENKASAAPKRRRPRRPEQHQAVEEGEGNWLVSYADMMTLLVGFFVMIVAFSKVDVKAYEELKRETTKVFGGEYKIPFEEFSKSLEKVVQAASLADQVVFQKTDEGIIVTFRGALFFESASAELRPQALELLRELIPPIQKQGQGFRIIVEGHTDNRPIHTKHFASNWELSSVRACSVLRLFEDAGFPQSKLQAQGWGQTKPILPNENEQGSELVENQAQNRRVVIKVLKD